MCSLLPVTRKELEWEEGHSKEIGTNIAPPQPVPSLLPDCGFHPGLISMFVSRKPYP